MPEVRSLLGDLEGRDVTLTGLTQQAESPAYLAAADVVVSPHVPNDDRSPFFGSPTKLFEYMAMARGIVASDLGQIGQVLVPALRADRLPASAPQLDDPNVAILATPGSVDELLTGIRFLVERPEWRASLGDRARARVVARYTWRQHVEVILERIGSVARNAR